MPSRRISFCIKNSAREDADQNHASADSHAFKAP